MIDFSVTTTVAQLIGVTLATKYRPSDTVSIPTILKNTSEKKYYMGYIYIGTDGKFSFFYIPTYAGNETEITGGTVWAVIGNATYII